VSAPFLVEVFLADCFPLLVQLIIVDNQLQILKSYEQIPMEKFLEGFVRRLINYTDYACVVIHFFYILYFLPAVFGATVF